jgi:signal peptidase I
MSLSRRFLSRTLTCLRALALVLMCVAVARVSLFTVYRVAGTSMMDTLNNGDRILVLDGPWMLGELASGDTVVLVVDSEVLVKRVMGVPGDSLSMVLGNVVRNGSVVIEDIPPGYRRQDSMTVYRLGPGEYFVMGDHRRVSVDSRDFGPIADSQILGRVVLRLSGSSVQRVRALDQG